MTYEFKAWPKTPRLGNEEMTITEKIDGTNACVCIFPVPVDEQQGMLDNGVPEGFELAKLGDDVYLFGAQSRTRMITPGKNTDNAGFAAWAYENYEWLIRTLGLGRHYGEWWGSGIQGGYGLAKGERRFSLFDVWRWEQGLDPTCAPEELWVVPTLYRGPSSDFAIEKALYDLRNGGSVASPGYMNPEGIIVSYKLTRQSYKAFVNDDGIPKSLKEGN